jgi:conjugal transfer pilin signal peptidase TrbI
MIMMLDDAARAEASSDLPRRRSLGRFLLTAIPLAAGVCAIVLGLLGRFQLVIDAQLRQCLPGHRVFVVDRARHDVRRGDILVFITDAQTPLEPAGAWLAKMVVGLPGDRVRVTADTVEVNGVVVGRGLLLADKVGVPPDALTRELVVPPGHVWAMGATVDSYDSRYYGPVPLWKMRGTATGLF